VLEKPEVSYSAECQLEFKSWIASGAEESVCPNRLSAAPGSARVCPEPYRVSSQGSILQLQNSGQSPVSRISSHRAIPSSASTMSLLPSYVRSSAKGDLNDFNSYFGNFENPISPAKRAIATPWDSPNRFLFWGQFPRQVWVYSGAGSRPPERVIPYSIIDEERNFVGPRDRAGRFPTFASLDLQALKSVSLPGRWKKIPGRNSG